MTIQEQINILKTLDNDFAKSLASNFTKYGSLSDKQMFWVNKLVQESIAGPLEIEQVELDNISQLFQNVKDIKYPKIRLHVNGAKIQLSRAGQRSRFPGSINITDGRKYGENIWYGRIVNGEFEPSRSCNDDILKILNRLNNAPVEVMAEYGNHNGECGFCGKELIDERSTRVGYGPVCAKRWNLPWGIKQELSRMVV